jgi:hypothetical protein
LKRDKLLFIKPILEALIMSADSATQQPSTAMNVNTFTMSADGSPEPALKKQCNQAPDNDLESLKVLVETREDLATSFNPRLAALGSALLVYPSSLEN